MSLKWLVGGEVNQKFISKQQRKELEFEQELDIKALKGWNQSQNSTPVKIKNLIEIWKDADSDFPKRFFLRHPELVPPELNPFIKQSASDLQLQNENLRLKNELAEKEIKLKELELKLAKKNQQTQ